MIRAHHDAVLAALSTLSGITVFDGYVPDDPPSRYVVLWADAGLPDSDRLVDNPNRLRVGFTVTAVGTSREQCAWLTERVRGVLLGKRLAVAGRTSWKTRGVATEPARRDDDVQHRVVFYAPDTYELVTTTG